MFFPLWRKDLFKYYLMWGKCELSSDLLPWLIVFPKNKFCNILIAILILLKDLRDNVIPDDKKEIVQRHFRESMHTHIVYLHWNFIFRSLNQFMEIFTFVTKQKHHKCRLFSMSIYKWRLQHIYVADFGESDKQV